MHDALSPLAYISLALVILLVVGVNLMLLKALRKKDTISEIDLLSKAGNRLKQPWKPEDDQLQALSDRVRIFKEKNPPKPSQEK